MYTGTFTKQSPEEIWITVDFATNRLLITETIASYTVVATKVSDDTVVTSTVIDATANSEAAGIVTTMVQAGTDGEAYKIRVTATTDSTPAAVHVGDILMLVSDT